MLKSLLVIGLLCKPHKVGWLTVDGKGEESLFPNDEKNSNFAVGNRRDHEHNERPSEW